MRDIFTHAKSLLWRLYLWAPFSVSLLFSSFIVVFSSSSITAAFFVFASMFVPAQLYDIISGRLSDPRYDDYQKLNKSPEYKFTSMLMAVKTIALVLFMIYMIYTTSPSYGGAALSGFYAGMSCGTVGMVVAHELMHRRSILERAMSEIVLLFLCYPHFIIYHVQGHHVYVGTQRDCTTAFRGESVYEYLPRTLVMSYVQSWKIQIKHLRRRGRRFWSIHNAMIRYHVEQVLLLIFVFLAFGQKALVGLVVFGITGIIMLEVINYTQHYGLTRKILANGQYEPVSSQHSWNFSTFFSNVFTLNLGRHSEHHRQSYKPYQTLRHDPSEPTHRWGIFTMFFIALMPPLWFYIVHPYLDMIEASEGPDQSASMKKSFGVGSATVALYLSVAVSVFISINTTMLVGFGSLAVIAALCAIYRMRA